MSVSLASWRYSPPPWVHIKHDTRFFKVHVRVTHGELSEDLEIADWTSDANFRAQCLQAKDRLIAVHNVTQRLTGNSSRKP